jgi:hypothetical protein
MLTRTLLSGVILCSGLGVLVGCEYSDHDHYSRDYGYHDYRGGEHAAWREERNKEIGDRNTVVSDKADDGRVNGSARSYEERKAARAADEGVPGAAREEHELRDEHLYGR